MADARIYLEHDCCPGFPLDSTSADFSPLASFSGRPLSLLSAPFLPSSSRFFLCYLSCATSPTPLRKMASLDPPSTLKPAQVALAMIESGVAKHRTRADLVFFKAVRSPHSLTRVVTNGSH